MAIVVFRPINLIVIISTFYVFLHLRDVFVFFTLVQLVHSSHGFYTLQFFGPQLEVVLEFGKHNTPSKTLNK